MRKETEVLCIVVFGVRYLLCLVSVLFFVYLVDKPQSVFVLQMQIYIYFAFTTQPVHTTQQCSYMGAWASQATVYADMYKKQMHQSRTRKPQKTSRWKNTGNVYPPDQGSGETLGVLGYASA